MGVEATSTDIGGSSSLYYSPDVTGQDDFLKLLTIQLKYQDPLSPMENSEFLAQLAQFSSLEQLLNVNGNLQANFLVTQSLNNSVAAGFIGKTVKAYGNEVYLPAPDEEVEDEAYLGVELNYTLGSWSKVTVKVYDEDNNLVRTLTSDTWQEKGDGSFTWDGKDSSGTRVPAGKYSFEVSAVDGEGGVVSATPFIKGKVTGVRFSNNGAVFMIGELEINFGDIIEVNE